MRARSLLLLTLGLAGCGPEETLLVVQVQTDLTPGHDFVAIRTTVGAERFAVLAGDATDWGRGVRVAELEVPRGEVSLVVSALGADEAVVVERPVRVDAGALAVVTVLLTRSCGGVVCPLPGDATATACVAGGCVDSGCSPETPAACGPAACASAADCPGASACTEAQCLAGTCFLAPDHAACAAGLSCDPDLGCRDPAIRARDFGPAVRIDELSTDDLEEDPTLTPDGLEIVFVREDAAGADLFAAKRGSVGEPFETAAPIAELNTPAREGNPALAADGLTLYFVTDGTLVRATRPDRTSPWGEVAPALPTSPLAHACPGPSADHLELAYCTGTPGLPVDVDLYLSRRSTAVADFEPGALIESTATSGADASAYLRVPGALVLYYSSGIPGRDLLYVTRPNRRAPFGEPTPLHSVNGTFEDEDPWLSDDERTIVFASDRAGTYDLYRATR